MQAKHFHLHGTAHSRTCNTPSFSRRPVTSAVRRDDTAACSAATIAERSHSSDLILRSPRSSAAVRSASAALACCARALSSQRRCRLAGGMPKVYVGVAQDEEGPHT